MNKGAVPIPYIIALLLGIAVVAILGYWFFVLGGAIGGEVTLATCQTRAHTYCAGWQFLGYDYDSETDDPIVDWFSDNYPECTSYQTTLGFTGGAATHIQACQRILGGESVTTTTEEG